MIALTTALFLLPITAQSAGGESTDILALESVDTGSAFGWSMDLAGDFNGDGVDDFLVGAPFADAAIGTSAGSATIHSGIDGSLLHTWYGGYSAANLGFSVAGVGDVDGDGMDDVVIGAPGASPAGITKAGRVRLYSGGTGLRMFTWIGANAFDSLGDSVAAAGDVNGDGIGDVLAAAPSTSIGGSVYVYSGADGSTLLEWHGTAFQQFFGFSVSGADDINGDGFDDVLVGVFSADPGGIGSAGSAFLYSGADGSILLQWHGTSVLDHLGTSVSGAGDVDGDGVPDVIIGSRAEAVQGNPDRGAAHVFSGVDGSLIYRWDGDGPDFLFGESVSGAGDIDGDGFDDLLVASPHAEPGGLHQAGSAYLFSGNHGGLLHRWDGQTILDYVGRTVAPAGNILGNGIDAFLVTASGEVTPNLVDGGMAYVRTFHPYLSFDSYTVSAATGGIIDLQIKFPTAAGFDEYKVLMSLSGTGPINLGVDIPLSFDGFVLDSYNNSYPFLSPVDMHGVLDNIGNSVARFTMPSGLPGGAVGRILYFAAIANQPGQLPEYSSVAIPLEIVP